MRSLRSMALSMSLATIMIATSGLVGRAFGGTPPTDAAQSYSWHALGSAPCVWFRPIANPDRSLNVKQTIQLLRFYNFSCAAFPIEGNPPLDWQNFQELLPAAKTAGIDLWPVLIPPTEGGDSHPYNTDYVKWMQVLASLSLKYPNLRGANIDDLLIDGNKKIFTHDYLCQIYQAKQKINPRFLFVPTVYELDQSVANRLEGCVNGVWFWWMNLERGMGLTSFLENARVVVGKRFPVYGGIYAAATSWHKEGEPSVRAFMSSIQAVCKHSDGVVIWNLSLDINDPLLQIAKSFAPGGSTGLADKCGEAGNPGE